MRIASGYDLLALATMDSDNIYPSKSPTCEPPMVACSCPHAACDFYEYTWKSGKRDMCRAPSMWSPEAGHADCPWKVFDVHHKSGGTIRHASNHKTGKTIVPARAMRVGKRNRRDRKTELRKQWVITWLSARLSNPAARNLWNDASEAITVNEYDDLADEIWKDWCARHVQE